MKFYLGSHQPHWLWLVGRPLFISRRTLVKRKGLAPCGTTWALDSGGFSELSLFGEWQTPREQYSAEITRWADEIGGLDWAACQDWMCEPFMLERTGKTIEEHQRLTIESFLYLRARHPIVAPVLQGWTLPDYVAHHRMYESAGVDFLAEPVVGVGSVCRRQASDEVAEIMRELWSAGLSLHGFGLKLIGLKKAAYYLHSADSLAWSFSARRAPPLEGCPHKNCANCIKYALSWEERVRKEVEKCESSFSLRYLSLPSSGPTGLLNSLAS